MNAKTSEPPHTNAAAFMRLVAYPLVLLLLHGLAVALPVFFGCIQLYRHCSQQPFELALTQEDAGLLRLARHLFHASTLVPLVLYHCRVSDAQPLFPATISHTIRWGVPRLVNFMLWISGWSVMLFVLGKRATSWLVIAFGWQMVLTGIACTQLCPVGSGGAREQVHVALAAIYMADHHFLCGLLRVRMPFQMGFYGGFAGLSLAMIAKGRIEERAGVGGIGEALVSETVRQGFAGQPRLAQLHWLARLAVMVFEYALFLSFVEGIGSDIEPAQASVPTIPPPTPPLLVEGIGDDVEPPERSAPLLSTFSYISMSMVALLGGAGSVAVGAVRM